MRSNKMWGIIWIIIALCLSCFLINRMKNPNRMGFIHIGFNKYDLLETKSFDKDSINKIDSTLFSESISFEKSGNDKIQVEIYSNKDSEPSVQVADKVLKIQGKKKSFNFGSIKIVVKLPAGITLDQMNISSESGSINLEEIKTLSTSINSSSGSIHLYQITGDGLVLNSKSGSINITDSIFSTAEIQSTSGSIHINDSDFDKLSGKLTSGSIQFEGNTNLIKLQSSSGSIKARLLKPLLEDSEIRATSGSISIEVSEDAAFDVDYSVGSGNYKNNITGTSGKKGSDKVGGGGPKLQLSSSSGSIRIK